MFCENCGFQMAEGTKFCPSCGRQVMSAAQPVAPQPAPQPVYTQPVYTQPVYTQPVQQPVYQQPVYTQPVATAEPEQKSYSGAGPLVLGLLAFFFSWTGLLGIILGAIGKGISNKKKAEYGYVNGASKTGRVFATLGIIFGIIALIFWIAYIIIMVVAAIKGGYTEYINNYY